MVEENRWLIYALGGGWGHLNRAIALARQAPHPVEILVNSPYATAVEAVLEDPHITLRMLPADLSAATAPTYVQAWISQPANCLIVDTFPRGLVGELADILPKLQLPRILIHRDLNPNYIAAKNITAFVRQHYDQILIPGEPSTPLAHLPQAHGTDPWLLREADELGRVRDQMRDCWQLPSDRPVIIICATGRPDEAQRFGELLGAIAATFPHCTVRCLAHHRPPNCQPSQWISHWPGMDVLQLADLVVGGAGYNLTYECKALQIPLIALPLDRQYDRQDRRAAQHTFPVRQTSDCLSTITQRLTQWRPRPAIPRYTNGNHAALRAIMTVARANHRPAPRG